MQNRASFYIKIIQKIVKHHGKNEKYIIKATRAFTRFQRFEPGSERFRKFQNPKTANRTVRFGSEKSRTGTETAEFGSVWNRVSSVRNQALPTLASVNGKLLWQRK